MSHTQRQSGGNTDENVGLASCGSGSPPPSTTASYDRGSSEYLVCSPSGWPSLDCAAGTRSKLTTARNTQASATLTLLGNSATAYTRALAYPVVATAAPVIPASPYHGHGGQYYGAPMSPYDQQSTTYSYAHYHTADVPSPVPCYFNGADQSQVPFYNNQPPSEHSKEEGSHSAYAGHVETEARRVFIRGISKKATGDEVEKLISRGIAGIDLKAVETIDVPLDQNNRSRGHAIVTFRNVAAAQQAVAQLGKMTFHGRALEARPAVDYPTVSASKSSSSGNHGRGSSGGTRGTGSGGGGSSGKAGGGDNRSHQGHADEKTCTSRGKEKDYEASDLARAQTIIAHGSSSYAPSSRNEEKRPCKK